MENKISYGVKVQMTEASERLFAALDLVSDEMFPGLEENGDETEHTPTRFRIDSRERFSWAMRKIRRLTQELKDVDDAANAQLERVRQWRQAEHARLEKDMDFFEGLVRDYFLRCRAENPRLKTLTAPDGAVKSRKQQPEFTVSDSAALLAVLKALGRSNCVRVKEEPAISEIKALAGSTFVLEETACDPVTGLRTYRLIERVLTEDGEIVGEVPLSGLTVTERPDAVNVDVE